MTPPDFLITFNQPPEEPQPPVEPEPEPEPPEEPDPEEHPALKHVRDAKIIHKALGAALAKAERDLS